MTWRFTDAYLACAQLLSCVVVGALAVAAGVVTPAVHDALARVVFQVFLPLHVCRGVALQVDFRDDATYVFVGIFLLLRAIALCVAVVVALATRAARRKRAAPPTRGASFDRRRIVPLASSEASPSFDPDRDRENPPTSTLASDVAEAWLSLTWVSTIIVGVPVLAAALGDAALGTRLGLLAAISSFIFQARSIHWSPYDRVGVVNADP